MKSFENLKYLHLIRGFAAYFVVLAHSKWPFWVGGKEYFKDKSFSDMGLFDMLGTVLALLSSNGSAMVIVFFVLSGFMITNSYSKNKWSYDKFLVNRAIRIYPPYIASMALAGIILVISINLALNIFSNPLKDYHVEVKSMYDYGITIKNFFITLLFYRPHPEYFGFNYVYWSLLFEMVFYLLFPFLFKYYKQIFIFSIIAYPVHFFLPFSEWRFFYIWFFFKYLLYFSSGIFLFKILKAKELVLKQQKIWRKKNLMTGVCLCFLIVAVSGFVLPKGIGFFFATIMACLWIAAIILHGVKQNIINKFLLFIGDISYSLYLIHVPILLFFYSLIYNIFGIHTYSSPWVHFIFAFCTLPFGFVFYYIFEKWSLKLIQKRKAATKRDEEALSLQPINQVEVLSR